MSAESQNNLIDSIEKLMKEREGRPISSLGQLDRGLDFVLSANTLNISDIEVLDEATREKVIGALRDAKGDIELFNNTLSIAFTILGGIRDVAL